MRILAVCIATRYRPESLGRLLDALADCAVPPDVKLHVRVADNDPGGSARRRVADAAALFPRGIEYVVEPRPGVAHVRNRLIEMGPADLVAFIDDDEWPERQWLVELLRVYDDTAADVVIGPVRAALPAHAPQWLRDGRLLDTPCNATGTRAHWTLGGAGNVLFAGQLFHAEAFRFNPAFGETGGEDAELAARLHLAGKRTYCAPNAVVHEAVPAERLTFAWLLRRRYRNGRNLERIHMATAGAQWPLRWMLILTRNLTIGAWRLIVGLPRLATGSGAEVVAALLDITVVLGRFRARLRSGADDRM